jgi:hypothetical protein
MNRKRQHRVAIIAVAVCIAGPLQVGAQNLQDKIEHMEQELQELKRELESQKAAQQKAAEEKAAQEKAAQEKAAEEKSEQHAAESGRGETEETPLYRKILDRVRVGGYGSFRFEDSTVPQVGDTFTFRRFVLTTDANIAPRLRAYFELEFERFRELEVEKSTTVSGGEFTTQQAIESQNNSEISLEQAWLQFDMWDWLRFRGGAVLVPLGRFNINHDDDRWDIPRRPLVDRGVPVLPVESAWDEVGVGFNGDIPFSDTILANYQIYVMNGVTLDSSIDTVASARVGDTTLIASEVELAPSNGFFNIDNKDAKALGGRFLVSPLLGSEIATSFYWGRYTPDFLPNENLYSISADGLYTYGPFEVEGEYVFTHFGGIENVARGLADVAINSESAIENDMVESEVEFELAQLATTKQGYWLEMRYRFWPQFLNQTVLGYPFQHPQLIAVARGEQVWFGDLVQQITFHNGVLTAFDTQNRYLDRATIGLAYRPVPLVVFQLAYEWTFTNSGQSLASVTNFIPAGPGEDYQGSFLLGAAFGF